MVKENNKGIAHLMLIIIVVVALGVVGYLVLRGGQVSQPKDTTTETETTDPSPIPNPETAGWKSYRNEKYGFELKFPPGWSFTEVNEEHKDSITILNFVPVPEDKPWGDWFLGYLSVYRNVEEFSSWFEQNAKFGSEGTLNMIGVYNKNYESTLRIEDYSSEFKKTTVDGAPAIVQTTELLKCPTVGPNCYFLGNPQGYEHEWYIHKQNKVFVVGVQTYSGPVDKFNQILSTFEFTDGIELTLEDNTFTQGKIIEYQVTNNTGSQIYYRDCANPHSLDYKIDLITDITESVPGVKILNPQDSLECSWDQKAWYDSGGQGKEMFQNFSDNLQVPPGEYRFNFYYYLENPGVLDDRNPNEPIEPHRATSSSFEIVAN